MMLPEPFYLELLRYTVYTVSTLALLGIVETLRRLVRMERKQDEQRETHNHCRLTLLSKQEFQDWRDKDFARWQEGRDGPDGLWHALNNHSHTGIDGTGKVVKT